MTPTSVTTRSYLIWQPAVDIPEEKHAALKGVLYIPRPPGRGLLYVEPEQLSSGGLEEFQPRGIVIPDYVFWNLIAQSSDLKFEILDVDFSADGLAHQLYKPAARQYIEAGKSEGGGYHALVHFLEELTVPITTVEFRDEEIPDAQHIIKLHGSGLITIHGDEKAIEDGTKHFLERLTDFLVKAYLETIHSESSSAPQSAEGTASVGD